MEIATFGKLFKTGALVWNLCWSLFPYYHADDRVSEHLLIGTFTSGPRDVPVVAASGLFTGGEEAWRFSALGQGYYSLRFRAQGKDTFHDAALFRLRHDRGETLFLDISPSASLFQSDLNRHATLEGHLLFLVELKEDKLLLSPLRPEWVSPKRAGGAKPVQKDERVILTESTRGLQKMLLRALADRRAFQGPFSLYRSEAAGD